LIFTAKSETPGRMRHSYCADTRDAEQARYIKSVRKDGRMITEATLLQLVEATLKQVQKKLDQNATQTLSGLSQESD